MALLFCLVAAAALAASAGMNAAKAPAGAIGQADAMTHIQVTGGLGLDLPALLLAAGLAAAAAALVCMILALGQHRR